MAVGLSDDHRHALAAYLADSVPSLPGRPVPPENWHVTIRYLGETSDPDYDRFLHALDEVDKPLPFRLRFSGMGAFPKPTKGSVLWLGVGNGEEDLVGLAVAADRAAVQVGMASEDRPYQPHLSLARVQPPRNLWPWLAEVPEPPIKIDVAEVGVYRSHLGGRAARYELLDVVRL